MPLSEHEERILAEIERQLSEDDPRFVERARRTTVRDRRGRRLRWSVVGFVVGFLCLLGLTFDITFGVIGFALMFASTVTGVQAIRSLGTDGEGDILTRIRRAFDRQQDEHSG